MEPYKIVEIEIKWTGNSRKGQNGTDHSILDVRENAMENVIDFIKTLLLTLQRCESFICCELTDAWINNNKKRFSRNKTELGESIEILK